MKQAIILAFLLLFTLSTKADYGYMSLSTLVCEADYGAIGTIVKLDKSYFYLKVEKYVVGSLELDTLKIRRFEGWNCAQRNYEYQINQKELVFFRKSNYVISDYELLGYGGGGEFELPIKGNSIFYNCSFRKQKSYPVKNFLFALKDFNTIKQKSKETAIPISTTEQESFSAKSELHKLFISCSTRMYESEFEVPTRGYIVNLEKNHLYKDYENKIYIVNSDIDSVYLTVDDAEVSKTDKYFIVNPKKAWARRFIYVYSINDKDQSNALFHQLFEILELPEPRIYFGTHFRDTIYGRREASRPCVFHYLDDMHEDEFLKYELLSYTYNIKSGDSIDTFKMKSSQVSPELYERLGTIKPNDQITISDAYVLYPNQTVRKIRSRTVIFAKDE